MDIKTLNTILVCLMVVVVGYSSYALTLIRATADTPMNQNAPSDIFTLRTYLAREQYGKTRFFMGRPTFRKYSAKTREEAAYPSRQKAN